MLADSRTVTKTAAPLSIALVTDWCPPRVGGVERHVSGLARALAARGHRVQLFTTTPDAAPIDGVTVRCLDVARIGDVAAPNLFRVRELRARLVDARVDVVHAHGMFSTLGVGGVLAAHGAGIASVTTHHSLLRDSPTLPAAWFAYRLFARRATVVSAVSAAAAEDARRASGRREIALLPNGFDPAIWMAAAGKVRPGGATSPPGGVRSQPPVRVVSVMRLARKKSPGDLIEAVPPVVARAGRSVVFTIVGDGPERRRLEQRARRLGVMPHVEFLGACHPARVADILARSHLFALPSRREAFGIALLEARAAGLPVVAPASGGIAAIVAHGRQGLLTRTAEEFVDALVRLVADEGLRGRLAATSRVGLDQFAWDRVVERHEGVYRDAMSAAARPAH